MTEVQGKRFKVKGCQYALHLISYLSPCPLFLEP